jgi:hypothetical protein
MPKQTYMGLTGGFWIPLRCLHPFKGGERKLNAESFNLAQWAYGRAESHRQVNGTSPKRIPETMAARSLPTPPPSPPARGLPMAWTTVLPDSVRLSPPIATKRAAPSPQRSQNAKKRAMEGAWR